MRRKIRITFPKLIYEVLQTDKEYFNLKKETLCNMIIEGLGFEQISNIGSDILDEKRSVSFNLNEKNNKLFYEMLKYHKITESEFLKNLFMTYANLHPSIRERILHKNIFLRIEESIRKKRKIKIYYQDKLIEIYPISFERNQEIGYGFLKALVEKKEYLYEMRYIKYVT